jgi:hypothetical protein
MPANMISKYCIYILSFSASLFLREIYVRYLHAYVVKNSNHLSTCTFCLRLILSIHRILEKSSVLPLVDDVIAPIHVKTAGGGTYIYCIVLVAFFPVQQVITYLLASSPCLLPLRQSSSSDQCAAQSEHGEASEGLPVPGGVPRLDDDL